MRPRSVVGIRAKRPTAPGRPGMGIAEVRRGKEALAEAGDRFRERRVAPKSPENSSVNSPSTCLSAIYLQATVITVTNPAECTSFD